MEFLRELARARVETDKLFGYVNPASLYDRPIAERHRMIFYLGHVEAFDWNQLKQTGTTAQSPNGQFDRLFAFGIDPEPGQLPSDHASDWPSLAEVQRYVHGVRQVVDREVGSAPPDVVQMMVEHRHMHAETFAYILHNLSPEQKTGPHDFHPRLPPPRPEMVKIPAGIATLGRTPEQGFGWDNEFRQFQREVPAFSVGRFKVTNSEYFEFLQAHEFDPHFYPHYWRERNGQHFYRGVFQEIPLPLDWPVYVTLHQARAYAGWRGLDLLSEEQYHRAAFGSPAGQESEFPWGNTWELAGNYDYQRFDPLPVHATPQGDSRFGIAQLVGNGWEWTQTVFAPFEGFAPRPTYPGYSANFFDDQHFVMKGASPRTAAKLVRRSLRNWFRPEYPYMYGTFRVVQN